MSESAVVLDLLAVGYEVGDADGKEVVVVCEACG